MAIHYFTTEYNWDTYDILGNDSLFPVGTSPRRVLPTVVSRMFPPYDQGFASAL